MKLFFKYTNIVYYNNSFLSPRVKQFINLVTDKLLWVSLGVGQVFVETGKEMVYNKRL